MEIGFNAKFLTEMLANIDAPEVTLDLSTPNRAGLLMPAGTPPAIINCASPALMARAALPTASRPEPHRRLMVAPGTAMGRPASSTAMRATLRLSSPAWLAQP